MYSNGSITLLKFDTGGFGDYDKEALAQYPPIVITQLWYKAIEGHIFDKIYIGTTIKFEEAANYSINNYFVREFNNCIVIKPFISKTTLINFIFSCNLSFFQYNKFGDQIMKAIAEVLPNYYNSTNFQENWIINAKLAIASIKVGQAIGNTTLIDFGYNVLQKLYQKPYYVNDGDLSTQKLIVANSLFDYNITYAKGIVDYVVSLLFNTSYGLQPLFCSEYDTKQLNNTYFLIGFYGYKVLANLANKLNDNKYLAILKEIIRFFLATLYYSNLADTYIDGYETINTLHNEHNYRFGYVQMTAGLLFDLLDLLSCLDPSTVIVDKLPPQIDISYWLGNKFSLRIEKEFYHSITSSSMIFKLRKSKYFSYTESLYLRFDIEDTILGYKNSTIYCNQKRVYPSYCFFRYDTISYLEYFYSPFCYFDNKTNYVSYYIPIHFSEIIPRQIYNLTAIDRVGNIVEQQIIVEPIVRTSTTGGTSFISCIITLWALSIVAIYCKRKKEIIPMYRK